MDLFLLKSCSSFFIGLYSGNHFGSILPVFHDSCSNAFAFYIDTFLNNFVSKVQILILGIQLYLNKWSQAFSEVSNQNLFVQSCNWVELL